MPRSRVVFPTPLRPSTATICPGWTRSDAPCTINESPYATCRSRTSSIVDTQIDLGYP